MNDSNTQPAVIAARAVLSLRHDDLDAAVDALGATDAPYAVALCLAQMVADRVTDAEALALASAHVDAAAGEA